MEEKEIGMKQRPVGLIVTIIVLAVIVLGMGVYIVCNKELILSTDKATNQSKNNTKEGFTKEVKEENIDINDDLVQNLYSIFRYDKSCYMNTNDLNNSNLLKLRIAYENIAKQNISSIECSKLELSDSSYCGDRMNDLMMDAYAKGNMVKFKEYEKQNTTNSIDSKLIEAKVHELFGSDYKIKHESFGISHVVTPDCYLMKYDSTNSIYAQFSCEGGGTCTPSSQELVSASKKNDELYIVTNITSPENESKKKVTYKFKRDSKNSNYVFRSVTEE